MSYTELFFSFNLTDNLMQICSNILNSKSEARDVFMIFLCSAFIFGKNMSMMF